MEQKPSITGCAMNATLETTLAVELFLNENYRLHQYPSVDINHVPFYKVIPLKAA